MARADRTAIARKAPAISGRISRPGHPVTLAENGTEAVQQIIFEDRRFHLRQPIDLTIRRRGPYWFIGYPKLGVEAYGLDRRAALESFAEVFSMTWDAYAAERDSNLSRDALETKRKLRDLVAEVESA
jgi:hypothetical protein